MNPETRRAKAICETHTICPYCEHLCQPYTVVGQYTAIGYPRTVTVDEVIAKSFAWAQQDALDTLHTDAPWVVHVVIKGAVAEWCTAEQMGTIPRFPARQQKEVK